MYTKMYGILALGRNFTVKGRKETHEDPYAVAVYNGGVYIVDNVPRLISAACSLFLRRLGTITCRIIGSRRYSADLSQGGLELPCHYIFSGDVILMAKLKKLLSTRALLAQPISRSDLHIEAEPPPEKKMKTECIEDGSTKDIEDDTMHM